MAENDGDAPKKGVEVPTGSATVALSDIHVRYRVPSTDAGERAKQSRIRRLSDRALGAQPQVSVRALSGVSFIARAGESIGVIGRNGSGKSTLLRIIAGLEPPTRGTVLAESTPVLLGVNAALVPELPGIQNIRLGLLAMGKSPKDVETLIPEVTELAGIGKAVYLPMRTYSSGMGSRLRFAIAAASHPDILLIDEALATGDAAFKSRSEQKMTELRKRAGTVFLVSHAAQTIEEMCTRAIWLHKGRIIMDGPAYDTARRYRWWAWNIAKGEDAVADAVMKEAIAEQRITSVDLIDPTPVKRQPPRHARTR